MVRRIRPRYRLGVGGAVAGLGRVGRGCRWLWSGVRRWVVIALPGEDVGDPVDNTPGLETGSGHQTLRIHRLVFLRPRTRRLGAMLTSLLGSGEPALHRLLTVCTGCNLCRPQAPYVHVGFGTGMLD